MVVYRIYDKQKKEYVKIGKRTNDLYVNKPAVVATLIRYYNLVDYTDRFELVEYDLVKRKKDN